MYYAHSTNRADKRDWQGLAEHLQAVAKLAESFGHRLGIGEAARLAGLLHDLGKYNPAFQDYIAGRGNSVDHSTAGAAIACQRAAGGSKIVAEIVAYTIAGHHAGLPDMTGKALSTLTERLNAFAGASLDPAWESELAVNAANLLPAFQWETTDRPRCAFQLALLGRMIFSCLVDADFKDTERFYGRIEGRSFDRQWPQLEDILPGLLDRYDAHMSRFGSPAGELNMLRADVLSHARSRAREAPGLYTLTVPTGGGKTLASLGFALDHARAYGHSRIIFAIPFTSIIDQTAAIFREVLGDEVVLEHHSSIDDEDKSPDRRAGRDKLKLAMEDWAAPLVVTTNVQLFESLFAARTSRARKLHNIANSVIILDEAQTLPRPLLLPVVWMLEALARDYGCTIVLCTATQPALDRHNFPAGHPAGLPLEGKELAPDPEDLARRLKRVTLRHAGPLSDAALIDELADAPQALVIVNSRKHALQLYRAAEAAGLAGIVHLTTRQYAADRRRILADVRQRLKSGAPCRLIATSLVEAGVDLDFPCGWRAEAGLDQIAQAAGRVNREGQRPVDQSIVTIFQAPDNPPPSEIKDLTGDMQRMMHRHPDLFTPAAMADFFGEVYWRVGKEGLDRGRLDGEPILQKFRLSGSRTDFSYRSAAENFRMIESGMLPVIVPGDEQAREAVRQLEIDQIPSGALARKLQTYIVQVPPKARGLLIRNGKVAFAAQGIRQDQFAVLLDGTLYDKTVGLLWEDADYLSFEQFMI
ncbi:MAG: CRISPR-associated helicase Cas3' [Devosia sp.]|uniref:CRISPR-associated helicase Cas3' n=1 Tax=Devosia sp. 66-22 TaxID=1895753 RepID=UPI00092C87D9|nr:CRISPR-associated helicase Cas3' [Devosia sp. 66-22]MBN9346015.1 CRISPR-associated helicase Cas3' [Devosia sp.]OJX47453.1 MAG: CRISPR-associated protein Cas3 [Devosia sp. 66-22]